MGTPSLVPANTPNDGLPSNWLPVEEPLAGVTLTGPSSAPPSAPAGPGAFYAASIPPVMQLQPDIIPTQYPGGLGAYRVMPPGPSGQAANNSQTQSVIENVTLLSTAAANPGLFLATNGTPNTDQNNLDFVTSSVNAVGLVATPVNSLDEEAVEISGALDASALTGTVSPSQLPNSGVTAGSYTNTDLTVDATGRITAASNGSGGGGITEAIQAFGGTTLSGNVSGTTSPVVVCSVTLTMPASGGPFRVQINWSVAVNMLTNTHVDFWITDGTNNFRSCPVFGQTSDLTGASQSLMTPVTYANSASVTFSLMTQSLGGSYTVEAAPAVGSGANFGMDCSAFPSV
jgi:hypothetical protein